MFQGNHYILTGNNFLLSLIIVLLITCILLWETEHDPIVTTQLSFTNQSAISSSGVCNYAKGRWVADSRLPMYPGTCKYIQRKFACRLSQRPDFSYEAYRWQPKDCELLEFNRFTFLRRMQDKTIAFVGDSLSRQQFQSLMCMATGGESSSEVREVSSEYGLLTIKPANGKIHHDGWAYRFLNTNTTILHRWSERLCEEDSRITKPPSTAMHLDRPPSFIEQNLHRLDVLVLNTAHHWTSNLLKFQNITIYLNGKPNENQYYARPSNAKNFTVHNLVRWLDSQLPLYPKLKVFFRTSSPKHFRHGDWNTGGSCNNLVPLTKGSEVWQDGSSDHMIESAVNGTGIKLLDITALSGLRDEAHVANYSTKYDCLHWCLPGVPDTWNEILLSQI